MTLRHLFGTLSAVAAGTSLLIYLAGWFIKLETSRPHAVWPFFAGTLLVFVTGAASAHLLKPHYQVDRVLQITRLRPFLTAVEYKSIWVSFGVSICALLLGMMQISREDDSYLTMLRVFSAAWFGFFFTDAMVLLRAKLPTDGVGIK